jgi:hypothetical protein
MRAKRSASFIRIESFCRRGSGHSLIFARNSFVPNYLPRNWMRPAGWTEQGICACSRSPRSGDFYGENTGNVQIEKVRRIPDLLPAWRYERAASALVNVLRTLKIGHCGKPGNILLLRTPCRCTTRRRIVRHAAIGGASLLLGRHFRFRRLDIPGVLRLVT